MSFFTCMLVDARQSVQSTKMVLTFTLDDSGIIDFKRRWISKT